MSRQTGIRATYMRGGTSKGVFVLLDELPPEAREPGPARDALCLRLLGSPDPYGKQIDGMGGATSSTSKIVIISRSTRPDCDVDYLFGQVAIDRPVVDWSGSCGNLVSAVGPFAIDRGLVSTRLNGVMQVRIWQANLGEPIVAHVPVQNGEVLEHGDFWLDGVAFPAPEIRIDFLEPGSGASALFPTGSVIDGITVDGQRHEVTLITAGNPTVFVDAASLGLEGTELAPAVDGNPALLARLEKLRAEATVRMGMARTAEEATRDRPHTPKLCFVRSAADYKASSGKAIEAGQIDVVARIMSMGKLHHAITGTGAVALAAAAAIPGTVVQRVLDAGADNTRLRIGHVSGVLGIGAWVKQDAGRWQVERVAVQRSARRLMDGVVFVPADVFSPAR